MKADSQPPSQTASNVAHKSRNDSEPWCVYMTYHPLYGFYYIGKSSVFAVTQQYYRGSGYGIDDELQSERGPEYVTEVLATFETEQQAYDAEFEILGTRWQTDRMCLNRRFFAGEKE